MFTRVSTNLDTKILCKHCKKEVTSYVKCVKCESYFHPSCMVQAAKAKSATCIHGTQSEDVEQSEVRDGNSSENSPLDVENRLMLRIIKEMESKYELLMENNGLLKEKIVFLSEKISDFENREKQHNPATQEPSYACVVAPPINETVSVANARKKK